MLIHITVFGALCCSLIAAEAPIQTVKPTNVLGSSEPHTSFSFIRPGLTQTSFAFSGPNSHQSFSSSIGNPQLAQRVLPSLAQILAYRNPSPGYYPVASTANGYGVAQTFATTPTTGPLTYQATVDPATALAYIQQQQQQAYLHGYQPNAYQAQLAQLLALRQAQVQAQQEQLQTIDTQQVPEQDNQFQQQEQQSEQTSKNLLGVAYSSAPSVAHVKVSGNGYKFDF
ncbi:uncharacterized protein LOC116841596 isoform X2 [Odontomachus brunneus]|uniref:uncharacterized protein LOC116841596 isoform X2 n=1 Tax=Odontomachus brunneus TaxID=486640 RepID=UPI0013F1E1C9|nr:uncharacterized protein LOC116841596 isoform X2 [Odontomachus brunneus]